MESQPQNPEFRINPENFHPCFNSHKRLNAWAADCRVLFWSYCDLCNDLWAQI